MKKLFALLTVLVAITTRVMAQEAYAVYNDDDPDNRVMTFYYDDQRENRQDSTYSLTTAAAMTPTTVDAARLNDKGQMINDKGRDGWYTLDGRRLDGKPAEKGVYLWNDKKVIVK